MAKYTLVCDQSCDLDTHVVTHTFTEDNLYEILLNMEEFLRGAGFYFDGHLTIKQSVTKEHSQYYYDTERNR